MGYLRTSISPPPLNGLVGTHSPLPLINYHNRNQYLVKVSYITLTKQEKPVSGSFFFRLSSQMRDYGPLTKLSLPSPLYTLFKHGKNISYRILKKKLIYMFAVWEYEADIRRLISSLNF